MKNPAKKKFSWKIFTSIALVYAFFAIFLTGIVLYMTPSGRVANWVNWRFIYLTKEEWQAIHIVFALAFAILAVFHLFAFNWGLFLSYLKKKSRKGLNRKREFYFSTLLMVLVYFGVLYSAPPLNYITEFSEYLKESWEQKEAAPPIPHAELLTLTELAEQLDNITADQITRRLNMNSIEFSSTDETLSEIAKENNKTPNEIYELITAAGRNRTGGMGIGRKTIEEFAAENGKSVDEIIKVLSENNIRASKGQTLRDVASANDLPARDIFNLITQ